eukprot:31570-Eustigmatos_ZCMA.PRE.1
MSTCNHDGDADDADCAIDVRYALRLTDVLTRECDGERNLINDMFTPIRGHENVDMGLTVMTVVKVRYTS